MRVFRIKADVVFNTNGDGGNYALALARHFLALAEDEFGLEVDEIEAEMLDLITGDFEVEELEQDQP